MVSFDIVNCVTYRPEDKVSKTRFSTLNPCATVLKVNEDEVNDYHIRKKALKRKRLQRLQSKPLTIRRRNILETIEIANKDWGISVNNEKQPKQDKEPYVRQVIKYEDDEIIYDECISKTTNSTAQAGTERKALRKS